MTITEASLILRWDGLNTADKVNKLIHSFNREWDGPELAHLRNLFQAATNGKEPSDEEFGNLLWLFCIGILIGQEMAREKLQ